MRWHEGDIQELSTFEAIRSEYLTDEQYREFQNLLLQNPKIGAVIAGTGGLRKVEIRRFQAQERQRGGLRTIYYWQLDEAVFWLFTIYDKDELEDLTSDQKKVLKKLLEEALADG